MAKKPMQLAAALHQVDIAVISCFCKAINADRMDHVASGLPVNWLLSSQTLDKFRKALQAAGSVPAQGINVRRPQINLL